jgi:predicted RNA-binding Zn ribbon-like protein
MVARHPIEVVVPGEPAVVRFMNTVWADRHGTHDALQSEIDLPTVLRSLDLEISGDVSVTDVRRARDLRDALRRLAAAVTEDRRTNALNDWTLPAATRQVNSLLGQLAPSRLVQTDAGWQLRLMSSTAGHALADLAMRGASLVAAPEHPLRACYAPGCVLYFVQQHARREWCSRECGNRVRAARHYARHRDAARQG